jgi:hypothetical protein
VQTTQDCKRKENSTATGTRPTKKSRFLFNIGAIDQFNGGSSWNKKMPSPQATTCCLCIGIVRPQNGPVVAAGGHCYRNAPHELLLLRPIPKKERKEKKRKGKKRRAQPMWVSRRERKGRKKWVGGSDLPIQSKRGDCIHPLGS